MQYILVTLILALLTFFVGPNPSDEYTYKVKNLKPEDYGINAGTWEKALSLLRNRLDADTLDTESLYLRAVTYREMGIRKALLLRTRDWKRSTEDFERIIARDSSFRDVLFQYGLLKQYKKEFEPAFHLMHRQQQITEKKGYVEAAIFRMYRYYFSEHPPDAPDAWFTDNATVYTNYFRAEEVRRKGNLEEADALLSAQFDPTSELPVQPILLSRARIYYALHKPELAQGFVHQAIAAIKDEVGARLFFEDFKYILSNEEIERYKQIEEPAAFQRFFSNALEKRNPTRADEIDLRMHVHYERLIEAESLYTQYQPREAFRVIKRTQRNQTADRDFPHAYWLNGELGDRGLIFVRHGKPDDVAASVTESTDFIESWRYRNPDLIFHFEGHSGLGVLIPTLPNDISVLEAREVWGGGYALLSQSLRRRQGEDGTSRGRTYDLDIINYTNELFDQGIKDVGDGLTTDRYVWPGDLKHIDLPYMVSSFKTEDNKTQVEVHYAVPIGAALEGITDSPDAFAMDVGYAVHDTLWNVLHKKLVPKSLAIDTYDDEDSVVDVVRFVVPADSYHVNLHVGIDEVKRKGSYLFGYRVPDFSSNELLMSDIIPAMRIEPTEKSGSYVKNGLEIYANPGRGFNKRDPLSLYYEIYNLSYNNNDQTNYSIRYTLEEKKKGGGLFRRKARSALSVEVDRMGDERVAIEYGELDVSSLKKGAYDLRVTITDKVSGTNATNYREIELR